MASESCGRNFSYNCTLFVVVAGLLLLLLPSPSAAGPLSLITESRLAKFLAPIVRVTITNKAELNVYYMCDAEGERDVLKLLAPRESMSFSLHNVFFPLRWCYVYVNPHVHGMFWGYSTQLNCTDCRWEIKPKGVYFINYSNSPNYSDYRQMNLSGEYF